MRESTRIPFGSAAGGLFALLMSVLIASGLIAPALLAGEDASATDTSAQAPTAVEATTTEGEVAGPFGLWVYLDPLTGEVRARPTAEQEAWRRAQPLPRSAFNKSSEGLVPFELDGGGRGVHLADRFRHSLVVTRAADGSFLTSCSDHPGVTHDHPLATGGEADAAAEAPVR